ncbi:MAG: hypothetical protein JOZ14_05320, partial [Acidobacteria bacterium]|nr:hypothetical protein [Acidobacteriota bacterium]
MKLADKSELYRSWADVEPLITQELERVNKATDVPTGRMMLTDFFEKHYLSWVEATKAAAIFECYKTNWFSKLKPHVGNIALVNLTTAQVTTLLTHYAKSHGGKAGLGSQALSRIKFTLSGAYQYAIALGLISNDSNPVRGAKWLVKKERPTQQPTYSLEAVLSMLKVLE